MNVVDGKDFVKLTKKALKLGAESLDFSGHPRSIFGKYLFGRRFEI